MFLELRKEECHLFRLGSLQDYWEFVGLERIITGADEAIGLMVGVGDP